jgi:septum formation protein
MRLILASTSPRRAELLAAAGLSFQVWPVDVDERALESESPADYVRRLASEKSQRAIESSELNRGANDRAGAGKLIVLGADTAVVVDGRILGKPRDDDEAREMLGLLSGRSHEVLTGVSLRSLSKEIGGLDTTTVWMRPLSQAEIAWYVSTGESRGKAGAYAIQGRASHFIQRISGSYANVVGLPVAMVAELLDQLKANGADAD